MQHTSTGQDVDECDIDFVSFGGVWLDDIIRPGQPECRDVVGGSATFATLGIRFFYPEQPARIALIVNAGNDFPQAVLEELGKWSTSLSVIVNADQRSTRGVLEHLSTGGSKFTRLTPPLLTSTSDIQASGALASRVLHLFADPGLAQSQLEELTALRAQAGIAERPTVIWEPHPKSCTPAKLQDHIDVLASGVVTVFSPNHHELNAFFDGPGAVSNFCQPQIEKRARTFLAGQSRHGSGLEVIIVRAAENGCLVMTSDGGHDWLPAYWTAQDQEHVVDPTGAGNAFLGGLAAGWLQTKRWDLAASFGTVAAGIVIEHVGPPRPTKASLDEGGINTEHWQHAYPLARLKGFWERDDVVPVLFASKDSSMNLMAEAL